MNRLPSDIIHLIQVDQLLLSDHYYLDPHDSCFFFYEYTPREGYNYNDSNRLISNLKKSPLKKRLPEYRYKYDAINKCAEWLRSIYDSKDYWQNSTFVPIPSSKCMEDPEYDDRIVQICKGMSPNADVRSIIVQTKTTIASHTVKDGERLKPEQLLALYRIDENLCNPPPKHIIIVDDMLTTGSHFKAMKTILQKRFPGTPIEGVFITRRRILPDKDNESVFNQLVNKFNPNL